MVSVNLVANTDLKTPDEFRQLVVKEDKGVVVRLGEIADVVLGAENYDEDVRFNGETATFMGVWVLPTANSLEVMARVREEIPRIQAGLPAGMKVGVPYDDAVVPTVSDLWATCDWHERETSEMFGIRFLGHPQPVKLLLSEPFEGHPLRKDFALMTREAKPWPGAVEGEEDEE
jgi:hypothetical protein